LCTFRVHRQVHRFDNIHKRLVLPVLDIVSSPRDRARRLNGDLRRFFSLQSGTWSAVRGRRRGRETHHRLLRLDSLRCNVHLQGVALRVLRVAEVEDFCSPKKGRGECAYVEARATRAHHQVARRSACWVRAVSEQSEKGVDESMKGNKIGERGRKRRTQSCSSRSPRPACRSTTFRG
jgi:hypothetical protein